MQASTLRMRLQNEAPDLYAHLMRSWDIALAEWLHAIEGKAGSSNSYPHVRNVELHVDQIVHDFLNDGGRGLLPLSPLEVYLLLSAVLFHDIGKVPHLRKPANEVPIGVTTPGSSSSAKPVEPSHGEKSKRIIVGSYSNLGIPSGDFADIIARLSYDHDPTKGKLTPLHTTVLEPYGEVRQDLLGALLTLADCMDASRTRVLPDYLADPKQLSGAAQFRQIIRGVYADPVCKMVRTVLTPEPEASPQTSVPAGVEYTLKFPEKKEKDYKKLGRAWRDIRKSLKIGAKPVAGKRRRNTKLRNMGVFGKLVKKSLKDASRPHLLADTEPVRKIPLLRQLLASGLVQVEPISDEARERVAANVSIAFSRKDWAAVVISDLRGMSEKTTRAFSTLRASGVPLLGWVIEEGEHLFNSAGVETYEPIFFEGYLVDLVQHMWDLSTTIFGTAEFLYEDLAAHMGETDVMKVKSAVRRVRIVLGDKPTQNHPTPPIWSGDRFWRWKAERSGEHQSCNYASLDYVRKMVKKLDDPNERYSEDGRSH